MKTSSKREWATSFTTLLFLVISLTGVFLFFHVLTDFSKLMHEILGLAFIAVALLHVVFNWSSMKHYFKKTTFKLSALVVLVISSAFVFTSNTDGVNPKRVLFTSFLNGSLSHSFALLDTNVESVKKRLLKEGIKIENANSIRAIAKQNNISPFEVIAIASQKKE